MISAGRGGISRRSVSRNPITKCVLLALELARCRLLLFELRLHYQSRILEPNQSDPNPKMAPSPTPDFRLQFAGKAFTLAVDQTRS
jgi:hypothetical protein